MLNPNALDAAANLDFQNSGSFEEKNLVGVCRSKWRPSILWGRTLRVNAGLRYVKTEHEMKGFICTGSTPPAAGNLFGLRPGRLTAAIPSRANTPKRYRR